MLKEYSNKIAIVDEASMISTIQMASLEKISQKLNFKVVYLGDTKQLDAVEAGIPFHVMQNHGMSTVEMKDIIRQNDNLQLKEAVYHSIEGSEHIKKAFNKVGDKNIIDLSKTHGKAANNNQKISSLYIAEKVVAIYKNMSPSERSETLFTAQTHEVRLLINEGIRHILQNEKKITGQPFSTSVLLNKSLTEVEKAHSYNYKKGEMVLFNGKISSLDIKKDSYYEILNINSRKNILTLGNKNGDNIKLKTLLIEKFRKGVIEVYQKKDIKLQEKERVIFTRTIKDLKITNSDEAQITKIDSKQIHLEFQNGEQKSIDKNHLALKHLDYSYAVTNHKAQGKTYKNVVGAIESWRKNLTNQKSFYVTISRAKNKAIIVTDNKEKSIRQITNDTGKKVSSI